MLRREADGVAWYLAKNGYAAGRPVGMVLELRWTCRNGQRAIAENLPGLVEDVRRATALVGLPTEVEGLSVGLGAGSPTTLPYNADGLAQLAELLAQDASAWVNVTIGASPDAEGRRTALVIGMRTNWSDRSVWSGIVHPDFLASGFNEADPLVDAQANVWCATLAEICHRTDAVWGSVMLDYSTGDKPAYERYFGIGDEQGGEVHAAEYARGYYWANMLSAGHTERLGGAAELERRCVELGLTMLSVGAGDTGLTLVRDPAPASQFDDARLAAMRDLLDPALVHRPYRWYEGPPLRVFKEPGSAYLPIPAGLDPRMPVFEDDEVIFDDNW